MGPIPGIGPVDPIFEGSASVSIGGGTSLDLLDPNKDGKLRLDEVLHVTNNFRSPQNVLCMFDVGVNGMFGLSASITVLGASVSTDDLPFPTSFDFDLSAKDVFGALGVGCDLQETPILASTIDVDGGKALRIHAGAFAADRLYGDTDDSPIRQ